MKDAIILCRIDWI